MTDIATAPPLAASLEGPLDGPLEEVTAFITYVSRLATSDAVRRRVAGAADRLVTPAESAALRAVADTGPVTFKGLAEHLELDQTTISRTANRLLEDGLVTRETDPDDRRKAWLTITADGDDMLHRLQHVATQWYEVAISEWRPEEQHALGAVLARFRHDLQRLEFDGHGRAVALQPTDPSMPDHQTVNQTANQEVCA
jgi:DNA-binding MarR family transcriptional regulator